MLDVPILSLSRSQPAAALVHAWTPRAAAGRRLAAEIRELRGLDVRALRDIGLTPLDVETMAEEARRRRGAALKGLWRRALRRLLPAS